MLRIEALIAIVTGVIMLNEGRKSDLRSTHQGLGNPARHQKVLRPKPGNKSTGGASIENIPQIVAWRNWQTRVPQERVGNARAGSNPAAPTTLASERLQSACWYVRIAQSAYGMGNSEHETTQML